MTNKQILIPVAEFHPGNTSTYVERALKELGIETKIIDQPEFFSLLKQSNDDTHFFCVDSGKPFEFLNTEIKDVSLENVSYWFIDFRHHKFGPRSPTDVELCQELSKRGGRIFQSQYEDCEYCIAEGFDNVEHLPLAADPNVWSNEPKENKIYNLAFTGNIWDKGRAEVLQYLLNQNQIRFGFPGHGALWMEDAAKLIRQSQVGFNVNSWYGTEYAFDLNMRFYETLSCGVPLITNWVMELDRLFTVLPEFIKVYRSPSELPKVIASALSDENFLNSGQKAREWIEGGNTYRHRMEVLLDWIRR
jgi:hypothetical protein